MIPRHQEADALAATKFSPPRAPAGWVDRPRLVTALEDGVQGPLTLLAAGAGAGKSALLSAWAAQRTGTGPLAWLSLEPADADRRRFWRAVFEALRRAGAPEPVASLAPHPAEDVGLVIPALVNALETLDEPLVLVLDDLHELGDSPAIADLDRLLRHPPPGLRIVISTRIDPALRVGRLRLEGAIRELREAALAFTLDESAALLAAAGAELEPEDMRRLWARTEGWAAGLRLAALTLRDHPDAQGFVAAFAGDDIAMADYLITEVLARQPPELADFLLRVSVAGVLSADLAAAVADEPRAADLLRRLEREHALITTMDGPDGPWYRCHPLLRELLQTRLRHELPGELPRLHRRAADWYVAAGRPGDALRHAAQAEAWDVAAALASEHWLPLLLTGEIATLRGVLDGFPAARVAGDAELALAMAATRLDAGEWEAGLPMLERAEELGGSVPAGRAANFALGVAVARLVDGRVRGRVAAAEAAADRIALAAPPRELRAFAELNVGLAQLWTGRAAEAVVCLRAARRGAEATGHAWLELLARSHLAVHAVLTGALGQARELAEDALSFAERHGWARTWAAGVAEGALSAVALERNRLDAAERHFSHGSELLALAGDAPLRGGSALHAARLHLARGRAEAALQAIERYDDRLADWPVREDLNGVAVALRARSLAALGRHADGAAVIERDGPMVGGASESGALAHLRLLAGDPEDALAILGPWLDDEATPALTVRAELWVLAALASDARADHKEAAEALERALDIAEPLGLRRPFCMFGANVRVLLRRQVRLGTAHRSLVDQLLQELDPQARAAAPHDTYAEALSEREAAVLRFLPTMMSNQEIAAELFVSVNTVKSHLKAIYRKLDVADRREAVRRARALELLAP
jgi:LuxR family maltose regulon positive regulatory protein